MEKTKLNDYITFNDVISADDFLFEVIFENVQYPETLSPRTLNIEYFTNHSGEKLASPLFENLYKYVNGNTENLMFVITEMCMSRYSLKWEKLLNTLMLKYNPIANVESIETFTYSKVGEEVTKTDFGKSDTLKKTGTITNNASGEDVTERMGNSTHVNEKEVSAYDSNTYEPTEKNTDTTNIQQDKQTLKKGTQDTETHNTTDTNTQSGTDVHTLSFNNRKDIEERKREGNIGVTMTQEMIMAERELWCNDVIEIFYKDLDNLFCLDTY